MPGIKYFPSNLNVQNKRIIVRVDFNVPLKDKIIQDSTRIKLVLPFLQELVMRLRPLTKPLKLLTSQEEATVL